MSSEGFFNKGDTSEFLKSSGTQPVDRDRLTMERKTGAMAVEICLSRDVGIGSRSQKELDDCVISSEISGRVAGVRVSRTGGVIGGGKWQGVVDGLERRLRWSLATLSEKKVAKSWGREEKGIVDGREIGGLRCKILLTVFHRRRGFETAD